MEFESDKQTVYSIVLNTFEFDSRVLKTNLSLVKAGYDVNLLALYSNGLKKVENINGINLKRLSCVFNRWQGNLPKIMVVVFVFILKASIMARKAKIIHCNDLQALPVGFLVKFLFNRRVKIVYDAHEYETEKSGLNGILKSFVKIAERFLVRYVDKIITVSDKIALEYQKLYEVIKPTVVFNCPRYLETTKSNYFREVFGIKENQLIFLYQGGLSSGRGIERILEAFKKSTSDRLVVVFLGFGPLWESLADAAENHSNMFVHQAVSPDDLLQITTSADIGLSITENTCLNHYYCLPNKMFEYFMADLPVVVSDLYEMRRFVEKYKVGIRVGADITPKSLREIFENISFEQVNLMKKNLGTVREKYNWERQERILLNTYRELIG